MALGGSSAFFEGRSGRVVVARALPERGCDLKEEGGAPFSAVVGAYHVATRCLSFDQLAAGFSPSRVVRTWSSDRFFAHSAGTIFLSCKNALWCKIRSFSYLEELENAFTLKARIALSESAECKQNVGRSLQRVKGVGVWGLSWGSARPAPLVFL